jgi:hypothetical protein
VGGALPFGPEDMPVQTKAWGGLKSYTKAQYCSSNGTSVFLLKQATHICSYLCKVRKCHARFELLCMMTGSSSCAHASLH